MSQIADYYADLEITKQAIYEQELRRYSEKELDDLFEGISDEEEVI